MKIRPPRHCRHPRFLQLNLQLYSTKEKEGLCRRVPPRNPKQKQKYCYLPALLLQLSLALFADVSTHTTLRYISYGAHLACGICTIVRYTINYCYDHQDVGISLAYNSTNTLSHEWTTDPTYTTYLSNNIHNTI